MTLRRFLETLEPAGLLDLHRQWTGDDDPASIEESVLVQDLSRMMTDQDRVLSEFKELPTKCRTFLSWLLRKEAYTYPVSRIDDEEAELPFRSIEVPPLVFALRKRGWIEEAKDRSWVRFQEPVYRIPRELGDTLQTALNPLERTLESQLTLEAFLSGVPREELNRRLSNLQCPLTADSDRALIIDWLAEPEHLRWAIGTIPDARLKSIVTRTYEDLGGIGEVRHLERLNLAVSELAESRRMLEERLLGTFLLNECTDIGLQLGPGSLILFLDLMTPSLAAILPVEVGEEPPPPADTLADIASFRTFVDHHAVRVTRDGAPYRATTRKMEESLLSPGDRPGDPEATVAFLLKFLTELDLLRPDPEGRLRTTKKWKEFDGRRPVEQAEMLLAHVVNDLKEVAGAFHQSRLRKQVLAILSEMSAQEWSSLKAIAFLARSRFFIGLDARLCADRFQKRYKYQTLPPLAPPAVLSRTVQEFIAGPLAMTGLVSVAKEDETPVGVRLTRLGQAVLGAATAQAEEGEVVGALIVSADFEIVLFPDSASIELGHALARFSKREKADFSVHYRISERTVQEAVAGGMAAQDILDLLRKNARYPIPQNVELSIDLWARSVCVLVAKRALILRAPSPESMESALKLKELRAIAGERISATAIEVTEDPASPKIAEALRAAGFFLR